MHDPKAKFCKAPSSSPQNGVLKVLRYVLYRRFMNCRNDGPGSAVMRHRSGKCGLLPRSDIIFCSCVIESVG